MRGIFGPALRPPWSMVSASSAERRADLRVHASAQRPTCKLLHCNPVAFDAKIHCVATSAVPNGKMPFHSVESVSKTSSQKQASFGGRRKRAGHYNLWHSIW